MQHKILLVFPCQTMKSEMELNENHVCSSFEIQWTIVGDECSIPSILHCISFLLASSFSCRCTHFCGAEHWNNWILLTRCSFVVFTATLCAYGISHFQFGNNSFDMDCAMTLASVSALNVLSKCHGKCLQIQTADEFDRWLKTKSMFLSYCNHISSTKYFTKIGSTSASKHLFAESTLEFQTETVRSDSAWTICEFPLANVLIVWMLWER